MIVEFVVFARQRNIDTGFHKFYQFAMGHEMKSKTSVIINSDDLGLSLGMNEGILIAAREGLLTSTCLRLNGTAYKDAVERILPLIPWVGTGLHLNIVEGRTLQKMYSNSSLLIDGNGNYRSNGGASGFFWLLRLSKKASFLQEVELDFRCQIETAIGDGLSIDHLNTHQHSHGIPKIFEVVCRLAREFGIKYVRLQKERLYFAGSLGSHLNFWYIANLAKWQTLKIFSGRNKAIADRYNIATNDSIVGILYTGFMNSHIVLKGVRNQRSSDKEIEVLLHPAVPTGSKKEEFVTLNDRDYIFSHGRRQELAALIDDKLQQGITGNFALTNYRILSGDGGERYSRPPVKANKRDVTNPLKVFVIIDETPFFHPNYLSRLMTDCPEFHICGVGRVKTPRGGALNRYMLRNLGRLSIREVFLLGLRKIWYLTKGALPDFISGNFRASIASVCKQNKTPCFAVDQINDRAFLEQVRKFSPDVILSSNELIFGEELLRIPKHCCLNRHSSLLPSYGGILPVFRAIQFGESHTGVTIHKMLPEIDKGDIVAQKAVTIYKGDTLFKLYKYCFDLSFSATREALNTVRSNHQDTPPPLEIEPSYYSYPKKEDWKEFRANGGRFI
jgi:methionyl-tRNA formyltransferase